MKRTVIIVTLLFYGLVCFCQQPTPQPTFTQQEYLEKSKRQKTTAWILLGGGVATTFIGLAQINLAGSSEGVNNTAGTIFFFTGLAATITSIPLFSAANHNRKKAGTVSSNLELKTTSPVTGQPLLKGFYPSLTVRVNL